MDPRIYALKGAPAAQIVQLTEEERRLDARELEWLELGADAEVRARSMQVRLDEILAELQSFAGTSGHAAAEALFLEAFSVTVPAQLVAPETSQALALRRKAYVARLQSARAEGAAIAARSEHLAALERNLANLQRRTALLTGRLQDGRRAPPARGSDLSTANPPSDGVPDTAGERAGEGESSHAGFSMALGAPAPDRTPTVALPDDGEVSPFQSQDRRVANRLKIRAAMTLKAESFLLVGFLVDLSATGVFFATYQKSVPLGTSVDLTLSVSGFSLQRVPGMVTRVLDPSDYNSGTLRGMGIAFDNLSAEALATIYAILNSRGRDFWKE